MSNRRRTRRPLLTLQEQLDQLVPRRQILVDIQMSENFEAMMRVAAAAARRRPEESTPDKQETPEVDASEVSTDRYPVAGDHDGRSAQFA